MAEIIKEDIEMNDVEMEVEETVQDKIEGLKAEVNQMERMIEENIRLIAEGNDVKGRTYLKQHLEKEVANKKAEIAQLESQIEEK